VILTNIDIIEIGGRSC